LSGINAWEVLVFLVVELCAPLTLAAAVIALVLYFTRQKR